MRTYPLPPTGEVRIGRSQDCHVHIDERGIADVHALLRIASTITVTNADNDGSIVVGGQQLAAGESARISPGVVLLLGGIATVIQSSTTTTRLRHVRSHDYFEARLEDECARVEARGGTFGVVRVKFTNKQAQALEAAFTVHLRSGDVVAMYAADEYELLLPDSPPEKVEATCARLQEHIAKVGCGNLNIGIAYWPRHGRSPEALLSAASVCPSDTQAATLSVIPPAGAIEALRPLIERIASSTINVLILGETGVGKEVLARRIHELSPHARTPMLRINCAALPETLLENELFGHERGAFTGAISAKVGLLEAAQGGTILLDEIAEMPIALQGKLLCVVENRQVTRLGGVKPRNIQARFIAATNRELEEEVARGRFRQDLFFRLNGISLVVPPLRERVGEIAPIAEFFIAEFSKKNGRASSPRLSSAALHLLQRYAWPGNVRELRNVVERAVMLCSDDVIDLRHLPLERVGRTLPLTYDSEPPPSLAQGERSSPAFASPGAYCRGPSDKCRQPLQETPAPLDERVANIERDLIRHALEQCHGNQTQAARLLGVSRRALITRIERHGLPRPRKT